MDNPTGGGADSGGGGCGSGSDFGGGSASASGGEPNQDNEDNQMDKNFPLPIANVDSIMRKAMPKDHRISKEAKKFMQECVTEFVACVTSGATEKLIEEKRKTINGDDLLWSLSVLGFNDYISPLRCYLERYRQVTGSTERGDGAARADAIGGHMHSSDQGPSAPAMKYGVSLSSAQNQLMAGSSQIAYDQSMAVGSQNPVDQPMAGSGKITNDQFLAALEASLDQHIDDQHMADSIDQAVADLQTYIDRPLNVAEQIPFDQLMAAPPQNPFDQPATVASQIAHDQSPTVGSQNAIDHQPITGSGQITFEQSIAAAAPQTPLDQLMIGSGQIRSDQPMALAPQTPFDQPIAGSSQHLIGDSQDDERPKKKTRRNV